MHLFKAKAEAQAKAEAKAEAEAKGKIESIIDLLNLNKEPNSLDKYKIIFAKSFFNVAEKPITFEDKELYQQLNELGDDKITPVGELDYSQAKIPSTQEEYSQAYARARKAVLKEVNKNSRELGDDSMLKEAKLALSSENLVINDIKLLDRGLGNRLAGFSNVVAVDRQVARVNSRLERAKGVAQSQAAILRAKTLSLQSPENANNFENLGLKEVVQNLSNRSDSINQRLTTQGRAPDGGNKTQSERETPSSSPKEPKASCLSGMLKAMNNFKTPNFVNSIYQILRSGSAVSKGRGR